MRIATGRREDAPAVINVDRRHSVRRLQEITQPKHRRRVISERDGRNLRALPLRHAEPHAPAEQEPGTIPCLRATCETLTPGWSLSREWRVSVGR